MKRSLITILSAVALLLAGISMAEAATVPGEFGRTGTTGDTGSVTLHHIFHGLSEQGVDGADPALLVQAVWKAYENGEIDEIRRDALLQSVSSMDNIGVNPIFGDLAPHRLGAEATCGWRSLDRR